MVSVKNKSLVFIEAVTSTPLSIKKGLGCKDVRVMRSLMIPAGLQSRTSEGDYFKNNVKGTMIGGNFCSWYGGFDSYIVAREIGNPISCPSMGRKQPQEDAIFTLHELERMDTHFIRI